MINMTYNDIVENDYILSKDGLKWIELNKIINKLSIKYSNIFDEFDGLDGFAFSSDNYVTRFSNLKNKIRLIQIGNVNSSEWIIDSNQKFEYLPNTFLKNKKFVLNYPCILVSLTGGSDINNDISSYFSGRHISLLNQRVSAFIMKSYDENYFFYFYALTKSNFFKEQWVGKGGVQKNIVSSDREKIYLPKINNLISVKFISVLTQAIINKEILIKQRHNTILQKIERELLDNQLDNKFNFNPPSFKEIQSVGRLDTGVYSEKFKRIDFLIKNYKNGYFFIDENCIKSGSTPEVRYIGNQPELKYRWITPSHCFIYGTMLEERINLKGKNNINKNCILLTNRGKGEDCGKTTFYNYADFGDGHHNQGIYRVVDYSLVKMIFIQCLLNTSIYRTLCSKMSLGSKMKELKIEQFLQIPFPNFTEQKQQEIAKLYYNPLDYPTAQFTLDNFLELDNQYNEQVGIYELDKTAKILKRILNNAITKIINDEKVDIKFSIN